MITYGEREFNLIKVAKILAENRSPCLSRKIGAIITNSDKRIICCGFNHLIYYTSCSMRNKDGEMVCPRRIFGFESGKGMILCDGIHAEVDVVRKYKESKVEYTGELFLYLSCGLPCLKCMYEIVRTNIKRIYCTGVTPKINNDEYYFAASYRLLQKNNIELIEIPEKDFPA